MTGWTRINISATASTTEPRCADPEDDDFWTNGRPIVGTCSVCGQAREDDYTCRRGGRTVRYGEGATS